MTMRDVQSREESTTGMIALFGGHALKHASNVQSTIALSTGESEYYAIVKGGLYSPRHAKPVIRSWIRASNGGGNQTLIPQRER